MAFSEVRVQTLSGKPSAKHVRTRQATMGRKVSDEWTVRLCATDHRALHTRGDQEK